MKKWLVLAGVTGVGVAAFVFLAPNSGGGQVDQSTPIFVAKKGDLVIDVLEGGNIQALEYLEYRNEVKLRDGVKILEIIDEGYLVTGEDVENGKVLVRLDTSALEEEIVDEEVEFQQTEAAFAEAKQNIEIAESEALSDIKDERQDLRFSLLDFEKFVGEQAAVAILKKLKLPYDNDSLERYEEEATELIVDAFDRSQLTQASKQDFEEEPFTGDEEDSLAAGVNFESFIADNLLGDGEAEQTIRRMRDEALVAASTLAVVEESVQGAKRLHEKEFITKQTLENELVNLDKAKLTLQTKETELELFQDYEFPKEAEKMLTRYEERLLSLIRTKREKMAMMSQVYARYRSAKRRYELQLKQLKDLETQLDSCIIRATMPGLVAYGGANENYYSSRYYEGITTGATLKVGQPIITIPDMSNLGVEVNIHESNIKKVGLDQKVYITAESVPDRVLSGRISKLAVLPDSNASRYNPSLKVYPATIEIEGTHDFLKPGMTAKVEIIVEELNDVVYVPVQSVFVENEEHFLFIKEGGSYEKRRVEVGLHNDEFIEVASGLDEAQEVLLTVPADYEPPKTQIATRSSRELEAERSGNTAKNRRDTGENGGGKKA